MEAFSLIALFLLIAAVVVIYVWCAAWAVGDAQKRGHGGIILLLIWVFGPFAALVWRFTRPRTKLIDKRPSDYDNPDSAIEAAVRLDSLGEWDAAIAMYQDAAARWPEHDAYIQQCIKSIEAKQAMMAT
jgi:hypothetical protein